MKKKLLFLLLAAFAAVPAFARWRVGASAGASYNWYSIEKHYQTDFHYEGLWAPTAASSARVPGAA